MLRGVALGMYDQDIAAYMGISKGTVHVHVRTHTRQGRDIQPGRSHKAAYEVFKTMGHL
ncbi:MAG: LuxR C-terminal-related transcriptional regulator [Desulfobacterales bacterium]|nr:LuxR C-terminal-related transcriptional regulator [Desulfobacterales bacterium]